MVAPGIVAPGGNTTSLVELVDIYPTLVDLAGLSIPSQCPPNSTNIRVCTEGLSMRPLLEAPSRSWKSGAFSQWPKSSTEMGYSIHTDHYRYTEWVAYDAAKRVPVWSSIQAVELYSHDTDIEENYNMANSTGWDDGCWCQCTDWRARLTRAQRTSRRFYPPEPQIQKLSR